MGLSPVASTGLGVHRVAIAVVGAPDDGVGHTVGVEDETHRGARERVRQLAIDDASSHAVGVPPRELWCPRLTPLVLVVALMHKQTGQREVVGGVAVDEAPIDLVQTAGWADGRRRRGWRHRRLRGRYRRRGRRRGWLWEHRVGVIAIGIVVAGGCVQTARAEVARAHFGRRELSTSKSDAACYTEDDPGASELGRPLLACTLALTQWQCPCRPAHVAVLRIVPAR